MKWLSFNLNPSLWVHHLAAVLVALGISPSVLASPIDGALPHGQTPAQIRSLATSLPQTGTLSAPPEKQRTKFLQAQLQTIEIQAARILWSQAQARFTQFQDIRWSASGWHFEALSSSGARCQGRLRESLRLELVDLRCDSLRTRLMDQTELVYSQFQAQLDSVVEFLAQADLFRDSQRLLCTAAEPCLQLRAPKNKSLQVQEDRRGTQKPRSAIARSSTLVLCFPMNGGLDAQEKDDSKESQNPIENNQSQKNISENQAEVWRQSQTHEAESREEQGQGRLDSQVADSQVADSAPGPAEAGFENSGTVSPILFPENFGFEAQEQSGGVQ